jgi:HEAT repeat protein
VLDSLLTLLRQGSPQARQEVLLIVQNLSDDAVIQTVLEQLANEDDPPTRHAIFKAIGKLEKPEAIPALILEIAAPKSKAECVREAAIALGKIASKSGIGDHAPDAVAALKGRYMLAPPDDVPLRAALLSAMAGVGDPSFTGELLDAVESDEPNVLRPAIRGLRAIGDASRLTRLRDHTAHTDPSVRLAAIEAVGELGREDADVESLLPRLNPTIESNEPAREAAWRALRSLLGKRPLAERVRAAERLRDMPELEARYLNELADGFPSANGNAAELEAIRDRLAAIHLERGNHAEAVPYLRDLYQMRMGRGDAIELESGLRWLDAVLHGTARQDAADVITQLAASFEGEQAMQIVEAVRSFLDAEELTADPAATREVLTQLREVPADSLPPAWAELLQRISDRLESVEPDSTPAPSP